MSNSYTVVNLKRENSSAEFPSKSGGRYMGASPVIAARKAARRIGRTMGKGTYHIEIRETTRGSRKSTHTYKIVAQKNKVVKPLAKLYVNGTKPPLVIRPAEFKVTVTPV